MDNYNFMTVLYSLFSILYNGFMGVCNFFIAPFSELIIEYCSWLPFNLAKVLSDFFVEISTNIGVELNLFVLMFGVGLPIFLVITIIKWFIGIIT